MFKEQEKYLIDTGEIINNDIIFKINMISKSNRFLDKVPEKISISNNASLEPHSTYLSFIEHYECNYEKFDKSAECLLETPRFIVKMDYEYYILLKTILEFTVSPTQERLLAAQNIVSIFLSYILTHNKFDKGAIKELKQINKNYYHNSIVKAIKECMK